MRLLHFILLFGLAPAGAAGAGAQTIVSSAGPERVAVTVYRDPNRSADRAPELSWLNGYALISETRRIAIPAGESEIRFEGVAGGILPQSAIVAGFPDGIIERNRDAYLLSPESLLDRSLGRRVHIRRTALATGAVTETEAVIRSGADGAVVLQTPDGVEGLRCTGLPEQLVYDGVPAGLSARPTLSVRARSAEPVTATITLSYLASGFDWQANYIASLSADGSRVSLFAWLTLANGDETGFANADTQAVAGRLNREHVEREEPYLSQLAFRCWPLGRTSDIPLRVPEPPRRQDDFRGGLESPVAVTSVGGEEIVLTGTAMRARQEELGDLKLYRIPEPVTVAARSQKQVAFLEQSDVHVAMLYRLRLDVRDSQHRGSVRRLLTTRNRAADGLGLPLPAGGVQLFASAGGRPILLGEGSIDDHAVGEDVEIEVGEATGVTTQVEQAEVDGDDWRDYVMTVTNDLAVPVRFEAEFDVGLRHSFRPRARLAQRDGRPLWTVTVPAYGTATLRYRLTEIDR
jgi:hypothetical protein